MRMRLAVVVILAGMTHAAAAEEEESPRALGLSAGIGSVSAQRQNGQDVDGRGAGAYAQAQYIFRPAHWFTPRLYVGTVLATPDSGSCGAGVDPCDVSAKIFFFGGKFRLMAPIPYVGPFIELGIGGSVGHMSTRSGQQVDATGKGLMYHVPFGIGLALGERHQFEIAGQGLVHPEQKQICGGIALGVTLDL